MSTIQNQTLQNQLLEIEQEEKDFNEKYRRFFKLEKARSLAGTILFCVSILTTVIVVFVIYTNNHENINFWDVIGVLFMALYFGFFVFGFLYGLFGEFFEWLIYHLYKMSKVQYYEIKKTQIKLSKRKFEVHKQIQRNREQEFLFKLNDLFYQLSNRKISFEDANTLRQLLEEEDKIIRSAGYQLYTNTWYSGRFERINEELKNYHLPPGTNHQPKAVEKTDTSSKVSQTKIEKNTNEQSKPEQQVSKTVLPINSNQKPITTAEIKPLSKPTTDSNYNTAHTQKSVVPSINNTDSKTSVVKRPEQTILSGIVNNLKKTQQRIKSVRIPAISPKKLVPVIKPITGEKKSTSADDVKTSSEPIIEKSEKTTITSFSSNPDNVTPVKSKPLVVTEEKTLTELFGEQLETETEFKKEPRQLKESVKTDYLKLNAHRHVIGERGEEFVLELEKSKLSTRGFETLSEQVVHVSKTDDSKGYDILSFFEDGKEKYLEVKTTTEDYNAPFYLSESELVAMKKSNNYFIYRVYNFDINTGKGKYFIMDCKRDLDKYYLFQPVSFRVSPKF